MVWLSVVVKDYVVAVVLCGVCGASWKPTWKQHNTEKIRWCKRPPDSIGPEMTLLPAAIIPALIIVKLTKIIWPTMPRVGMFEWVLGY